MHISNDRFWRYCRKKYFCYFDGPRDILEVGSLNVNGSVRRYFTNFKQYIGVDWRAGPDVDVVCLAEDMNFDKQFNVVISCSMLEHDPHWDLSLLNMTKYLKEDGILLLSWGSACCFPHQKHTAIDGEFHGLPVGPVLQLVREHGIYIHEFHYEGSASFIKKRQCLPSTAGAGMGIALFVGFKNSEYAIGEQVIDQLLPEDEV
jgi:SAM-dependent methyltransferase